MLKKPNSKKEKARKKRKNYIRYRDWCDTIYGLACGICEACGEDIPINTIPHHINFRSKFKNLIYIIWNGILLCGECHDKIHKGLGLHSKITGRQWMIGVLEKLPDRHRCKKALLILKQKEGV